MPGVLARSVTAAVGRPPTQKKASILRSLSADADSATPSRSRRMSLSLSRPAASMTRKAMTSVALPPEPVDTRLPFRSAILRIQDHQRAHRDRPALELVLALQRVERGVGHSEGDVGLAGADELQVGDRAAGHLGGGLHAVNVLG